MRNIKTHTQALMLSKLFANNIIIYPEFNKNKKWFVQIDRQGRIVNGTKEFSSQTELQRALATATKYEYEKFVKENE